MTNDELDRLFDLSRKATQSAWQWAETPTRSRLASAWWMVRSIFKGRGRSLWGVMIGTPDKPVWIAVTGNGPSSEANSAYLVAAQPKNIQILINAFLDERRRRRDAEELARILGDRLTAYEEPE